MMLVKAMVTIQKPTVECQIIACKPKGGGGGVHHLIVKSL